MASLVTGSSPVLTTLIKLVYEQPLRWDALIRNGSQVAELERRNGKCQNGAILIGVQVYDIQVRVLS